MSNHAQLVVVPERQGAVARTFCVAQSNCSRWLSIRLRRGGACGRTGSVPVRWTLPTPGVFGEEFSLQFISTHRILCIGFYGYGRRTIDGTQRQTSRDT